MDLSIIIVNWNSKDYLGKCLLSIEANRSNLEYEIVVIDSASYDGCDRMLRERFPGVRFIQSEKNLGFARANNIAFEGSSGRQVLFLNPDTEVVGSALATMLEQLRTLPAAGSVGCKLLNTDGTIQTSCIQSVPTILNQALDSEFLRKRWPKAGLWGMEPLYSAREDASAVQVISGACVMLNRQVFEQVGRFNEDYFMYAEDVDLSYKLTRAGYRNYYVPTAEVVHHGGGSSVSAASDFSTILTRDAICRFFRKTRGPVYAFGYRVTVSVASCLRLILLVAGHPVQSMRSRSVDSSGSVRKWIAALRWSLFLSEHGRYTSRW